MSWPFASPAPAATPARTAQGAGQGAVEASLPLGRERERREGEHRVPLYASLGSAGRFREAQQNLCRLRQLGSLALRSKTINMLHQRRVLGLMKVEKQFRKSPGHLSGIDARMRKRADRHLGRSVALA